MQFERLRVEGTEDPRTFRLVGELDLSTAENAAGTLSSAVVGDGDLTLDISQLAFVDSTGLRLLLQIAQTLEGRGRLILAFPQDNVDRLLDLTGLDRAQGLVIIDRPL